jgi:hypothetical protein
VTGGPGPADQGRRVLDEALRLLEGLAAPGSPAAAPVTCTGCPLCRAATYLRTVEPSTVDRLAGAVTDLGAALRDLLGGEAGRPAPGAPVDDVADASGQDDAVQWFDGRDAAPRRVDVQRIDVTD